MPHIIHNDGEYNKNIEYQVIMFQEDCIGLVNYKTLQELFENLYRGDTLLFDTSEKRQVVRDRLNKNALYTELENIVINEYDSTLANDEPT